MKLTRLSVDDFDRIASLTRLGETACAMARAVLVDGRTQVEVASAYGVTRQRVHLAVGVIEKAYMKNIPPGHNSIRVSLELPEILALSLYGFMEILNQNPKHPDRDQAIASVEKAISNAQKKLITRSGMRRPRA